MKTKIHNVNKRDHKFCVHYISQPSWVYCEIAL